MKKLLPAFLAFVLPAALFAQTSSVPGYISYQGKVTDATGTPIGNTAPVNRVAIFRVWDSPTATAIGNRLYSEQQNVTISGGEFSVLIGAGTAFGTEAKPVFTTVFAGPTTARYLGVTVDNGDGNLTNDPESSPRQQMVATAFAFRSQVAEAVASGGVGATALANNAVGSAALATGAVTGIKLASAAVGTTALADSSVTAGKLVAGAVLTAGLADGAVTTAKLAAGALDATKIADGAVTLAKHAASSVDSSKIVDASVATADLADGAVTLTKLAANSVDTSKIVDATIATADLANASVTLAKQAANSIDSSKIVDGSVALADLTTTVRDGLPKQRAIYNQAVNPDYVTRRTKGDTLIPIEIGDLADDDDGMRLAIFWFHSPNPGWIRVSNLEIWLQRPGMTTDPDYPNLVRGYAKFISGGGVGAWIFRLNRTSWAQGETTVATLDDNYISFYTAYPGSRRAGETAPFNQNQDNNASNANAGGPAVDFSVTSVTAGTGTLTVVLNNPHAIQVGNTLTIAGMTGAASPNTTYTVSALPDRMSFTVPLAGATGSYSGGTVTHKPTYSKFRIWAAVHPDFSARIIAYDR